MNSNNNLNQMSRHLLQWPGAVVPDANAQIGQNMEADNRNQANAQTGQNAEILQLKIQLANAQTAQFEAEGKKFEAEKEVVEAEKEKTEAEAAKAYAENAGARAQWFATPFMGMNTSYPNNTTVRLMRDMAYYCSPACVYNGERRPAAPQVAPPRAIQRWTGGN